MHLLQNPDYVLHAANSHIQELLAQADSRRQLRALRRGGRVRALVSRGLIAAGESLAA